MATNEHVQVYAQLPVSRVHMYLSVQRVHMYLPVPRVQGSTVAEVQLQLDIGADVPLDADNDGIASCWAGAEGNTFWRQTWNHQSLFSVNLKHLYMKNKPTYTVQMLQVIGTARTLR